MIKEIQYQGYATASSDYECPDGQLALSLNLISEDGQLKPILPPKEAMDIPENSVLMYVHETASYRHTIYKKAEKFGAAVFYHIYWINEDGESVDIKVGFIQYRVKAIGNILILLSDSETEYYIFKDGTYKHLGNKLPEVNVSFTLKGFPLLYSLYDEDKKVIELTFENHPIADEWGNAPIRFKDADKKKVTEYIMAAVNKFIQEQTIEKERFMFPFFVRYAYKLYDGSTTMASAPILITPSTLGQPLVLMNEYSFESKKAKFDIFMTTAELQYQFLKGDDLSNWKDIIKSIDVYISKPIYGYKQDGEIETLFDTAGTTSDTPYYNTFVGHLAAYDKNNPSKDGYHDKGPCMQYRSNLAWDGSVENDPIYKKNTEWFYDDLYFLYFTSNMEEKNPRGYGGAWRKRYLLKLPTIPSNLRVEKEIENTYLFYKVASIDPYKETSESGDFKTLEIHEDTLKSLTARETLKDDFLSHDRRILGESFEYNSRINAFSMKRVNFNGFTAQSMFQYVDSRMLLKEVYEDIEGNEDYWRVLAELTFKAPTEYKILTLIENNDKQNVVLSSYGGNLPLAEFCNTWNVKYAHQAHYNKISWPSFFYYPNPNAKQMIICNEIADESGNKSFKPVYSISLTQHDYLNGAFARLDFNTARPYVEGIEMPEVINTIVEEGKNKIYTSEVNNPFVFPPSYVTTVGDGEILGLSTAAMALSQGQFGQFPLYAFTTDGIWALQVSNDGTFSSRQPISRDVCVDKNSITQLDQSVVFATDRGIMIIEGSTTSPITDAIFTNAPFDVTTLQHIDVLHKRIGHDTDTCIPTQPFNTYMKGCRMAYDYTHQRIYVYNPDYSYAYVFSLKSKMWGMVEHNFLYSINSFPDTKVVTKDNKLLNFSGVQDDNRKGMFITRPLKLESPDVLKTITSLIQRGYFDSDKVATILYASRNLKDWFPIASSADHRIQRIHGTPYKYFRIAVCAHLHDGQSIFGASVDFLPKFNNKLR